MVKTQAQQLLINCQANDIWDRKETEHCCGWSATHPRSNPCLSPPHFELHADECLFSVSLVDFIQSAIVDELEVLAQSQPGRG